MHIEITARKYIIYVHMSIDSMSISSCFNKTVLRRLYIYIYIYIYIYVIIFGNVLLILHAHMFLIESQLGVHTLKDKRRAKEK